MKNSKKIQMIFSLAIAMGFGILLGFTPLSAQAEEENPALTCAHNRIGTDGLTNFCSGTVCGLKSGNGSFLGPCGGV
ncbi:hypothetical protein [Algoriphagus chordae]|uniref:Secreted protein n=1 Tax=Algoriphagus chordae TaxID=237019 RepID=A0A2W7R6S6_9BACT|nr:hypothetical protein [Algoriphagus chordae]PZX49849.1 hypothetical protein LV85_02912 [Algoriphagus chordae]